MSRQSGGRSGRTFQQVLRELHRRLAEGVYEVGANLPPERELAAELGVSRDTLRAVVKELVSEGWVESRQGSGRRVLKTQVIHSTAAPQGSRRPITLGSFLGAAFEEPEVALDVYSLTSESLSLHIGLLSDRLYTSENVPQRIKVRMLLPSETSDLPYPRSKVEPADPRVLERLRTITLLHTALLRSALLQLQTDGLVPSVEVEIRHLPVFPTSKLYLLNNTQALYGSYEPVERRIRLDSGEELEIWDLLGVGSTLTHFIREADPSSQGSAFVESKQRWFESWWAVSTT